MKEFIGTFKNNNGIYYLVQKSTEVNLHIPWGQEKKILPKKIKNDDQIKVYGSYHTTSPRCCGEEEENFIRVQSIKII